MASLNRAERRFVLVFVLLSVVAIAFILRSIVH